MSKPDWAMETHIAESNIILGVSVCLYVRLTLNWIGWVKQIAFLLQVSFILSVENLNRVKRLTILSKWKFFLADCIQTEHFFLPSDFNWNIISSCVLRVHCLQTRTLPSLLLSLSSWTHSVDHGLVCHKEPDPYDESISRSIHHPSSIHTRYTHNLLVCFSVEHWLIH